MFKNIIGAYFKKLGPGLTTGAADDDPAGIATYSQAGAGHGYQFLWAAIFTFPFMIIVQEMCARIGIVTGQGLAANIRRHYSKTILYTITFLLFFANVFNIGADLGAMAEASRLLFPSLPFIPLVIFFTFISLSLQIYLSYPVYSTYLKWLSFALFSYIIAAFTLTLDWKEIFLATINPQFNFSSTNILILAAILGTTISPYLFFWQTSQEVEEKNHQVSQTPMLPSERIKDMRVDVISGMFVSNVVMFFIIVVCGSTLFRSGITNIDSAASAAAALKPLVGNGASLLFAIGVIGAGLLAVPVLAGSASYAVSETIKQKSGVYKKSYEIAAFYIIITLAMFCGFLFNFFGFDPIKALIYSSVLNCLIAPLVLILIIKMAMSSQIMGKYRSGRFTTFFGWVLVVIMGSVSLGILASFI